MSVLENSNSLEGTIALEIAIVPPSPNRIEHWSKRSARNNLFAFFLKNKIHKLLQNQFVTVTITRVSPRALDDDNLISSYKGLRDKIADQLIPNLRPGQADSSAQIKWVYNQSSEGVKKQFTRINLDYKV